MLHDRWLSVGAALLAATVPFLILQLFASPARADAPQRIVVAPVRSATLEPDTLGLLDRLIATELAENNLAFAGVGDVGGKVARQLRTCTAAACGTTIAQQTHAAGVLWVNVDILGTSGQLSVVLFDVASGMLHQGAARSSTELGEIADRLRPLLNDVLGEALGRTNDSGAQSATTPEGTTAAPLGDVAKRPIGGATDNWRNVAQCLDGEEEACGENRGHVGSLSLVQSACAGGDVDACAWLANEQAQPVWGERAVELLINACERDSAAACTVLIESELVHDVGRSMRLGGWITLPFATIMFGWGVVLTAVGASADENDTTRPSTLGTGIPLFLVGGAGIAGSITLIVVGNNARRELLDRSLTLSVAPQPVMTPDGGLGPGMALSARF